MPRRRASRRKLMTKTADQTEAQTMSEAALEETDELEKCANQVDTNTMGEGTEPPHSRARSSSPDRERCGSPQGSQGSLSPHSLEQSLDQDNPFDVPAVVFERWPRADELVLSDAGSPLAFKKNWDDCADVYIYCESGVITVRPYKMTVPSKHIMMQLDEKALQQVKILHAHLELLIEMATKVDEM
ncbi:borealin-like [Drosophila persimilis]|uniref:borealin-like n=1 Tax=Drosophila persimilis TaxID=7234 RepID=UPI000F08B4C9|nr:borealin-like [Drosophila persimilis]XP_026850102.1 borealin-like [Drosophila persimilis]XP_026850133.1 borealin-like [Drosophila persimilis]XP_026850134.1 borealin-like [Drosophila persimilis]